MSIEDDSASVGEPSAGGSRKKVLYRVVAVVVIAVVAVLFGMTLANNWEQVLEQDLTIDWWWLAAILAFSAAVVATGLCWGSLVRTLDQTANVSSVEAVSVQSLSWVLKYIPGQVGSVANKVLWAKRKGISRTLVVITFLYENIFLQLASFIPSLAILVVAFGTSLFDGESWVVVVSIAITIHTLFLLSRPVFSTIVAFPARKLLKRDVPKHYFLSTPQSIGAFFGFIVPRVLNGVGFVFIAISLLGIGPEDWLAYAAAYTIAGAIGILAFLVPSGLGVREAVLVVLLSPMLSAPEAIVLSLVARLLSTLADAVVAAIYACTRQFIPKEFRP